MPEALSMGHVSISDFRKMKKIPPTFYFSPVLHIHHVELLGAHIIQVKKFPFICNYFSLVLKGFTFHSTHIMPYCFWIYAVHPSLLSSAPTWDTTSWNEKP